jgi:hypothetical protein
MQEQELQYDKGQERASGAYGNKEILQILQETYSAQGNEIKKEQVLNDGR